MGVSASGHASASLRVGGRVYASGVPPFRLGRTVAVSRPYFWLVTLWLYLLPTGQRYDLLHTPRFWLGIVYCTLPLNLMCYLMNDLADVDVDSANPRKGGRLLGAKESAASLGELVPVTAWMQLAFLLLFHWLVGARVWLWFGGVFACNWCYNFGPRLSARYAPLDLFCPCGYVLVILLSVWLNSDAPSSSSGPAVPALPYPPARAWAHAVFLVVRTQLWLQTFDIGTDAAAGRRNTAVVLGLRRSQAALAALLLAECAFVRACFEDWALRSFSPASLAMLGAQLVLAPGGGGGGGGGARAAPGLSPEMMTATFVVLGAGGVGLMAQVWCNAAFS